MASTQLPPLSQILHKGASGGHEFAHLVRMLFEAEERVGDGFRVQNFDDCTGDIDGADAFIYKGIGKIRVQIRFNISPFKSQQRSSIKSDYEKSKVMSSEDDEWWLITPDDLQKDDLKWFNETFDNTAHHKGESYLTALFLRHPEIGEKIYVNYPFRQVLSEQNTPLSPENYFKKFLNEETQIELLFARAQPTYYDCKRIFNDDWWEIMGDVYNEFYRDMSNVDKEREKIQKHSQVDVERFSWNDFKSKGEGQFSGGIRDMKEVIRENVEFYFVNFHSGDKVGYIYEGWCFISGRWVFFGKLYRFWRMAKGIQSDNDVLIMLKLFKCINVQKRLKNHTPQKLRLMSGQIIRELKKQKK